MLVDEFGVCSRREFNLNKTGVYYSNPDSTASLILCCILLYQLMSSSENISVDRDC